MNLAIEYLLRHDELKNMIKFPYSVFISQLSNGDKIVITIHQKKSRNKLIVKHWHVLKCSADQRVPPFSEFEVEQEEMFTSTHTVIPRCELLWYQEEPYPPSVRQYADFPHSEQQQEEYRALLSNFLNSARHKRLRDEWLWQAFMRVYLSDSISYALTFSSGDRIKALRLHAPELINNWMIWKKYLLDYSMQVGDVAGELMLQKAYLKQMKATKDLVLINSPKLSF